MIKDTNCASQNGIMNKAKNIKNIVFDFGGVLLDIDYNLTYDAMKEILHTDINPEFLSEEIKKIFYEFETGKSNVETFLWNIQRMAKKEVPHGKEIIDAWNAMLIGWDASKFDLLLDLRKKYNVYLLSNTNELHLNWVYADLAKNHKITDFDNQFFDKTFYSHLIGYRKPDAEIFNFVTNSANVNSSETLFIDDMLQNIVSARLVGWHAYLHNPADNLSMILKDTLHLNY